jgi:hypothetical protein
MPIIREVTNANNSFPQNEFENGEIENTLMNIERDDNNLFPHEIITILAQKIIVSENLGTTYSVSYEIQPDYGRALNIFGAAIVQHRLTRRDNPEERENPLTWFVGLSNTPRGINIQLRSTAQAQEVLTRTLNDPNLRRGEDFGDIFNQTYVYAEGR